VTAQGVRAERSRGAVHARDGVVARMPATRLRLAGDKVLPVSTGEAPGRR
jgi:hypothetical protein